MVRGCEMLVLVLVIIPSSYGLSVSCMMEYDNGGAPAIYEYLGCRQWILSAVGSLPNQTRNCQFAILQGRRDYQEDAIACNLDFKIPLIGMQAKNGFEEEELSIVAVFDGHGGKEASEIASKHLFDYFYLHFVFQSYKIMARYQDGMVNSSDYKLLQLEILKEALSRTIGDIDLSFSQEAIKNNIVSGSTATIVFLYDGQILVAHVGDSRALLFSEKIGCCSECRCDSMVHLSATRLTNDHHPNREDERARIEAAGGSVVTWGVPRVNGMLAMSRSIGDVYLKRYGIICEPEYTGWRVLTGKDAYVVVASDGIFESLTEQDISDLISEWNMNHQDGNKSFRCRTSTSLAECIVNTAFEKGSQDNLSAIVVPFRPTSFLHDV